MSACDACLRRAALLSVLGPWVARAAQDRRKLPVLLALPDDDLLTALCGTKRAAVERRLASFDPATARRRAQARGMKTICRHLPVYPRPLLDAPDAPVGLHLIGDAELLERVTHGAVAVVGSRRASPYGREMARALGRELAACGVPVVSGMAYGVDSAAHEGALAAGGPTIAVMPGGADVAYPAGKRHLYTRVREHGLIVAEMPPGMRPFKWSFPARNRIMAALTGMTVVVEGTEGSGSLITASFAEDLGREVGAVPGQATSAVAAGPNRLLAEGAVVVRSAADVLDALFGVGNHALRQPATNGARPAPGAALEPRLRELLVAVENGAGSVDRLAAGGLPVADVLAGLSELEFLGFVARGPGGDYVRRA